MAQRQLFNMVQNLSTEMRFLLGSESLIKYSVVTPDDCCLHYELACKDDIFEKLTFTGTAKLISAVLYVSSLHISYKLDGFLH